MVFKLAQSAENRWNKLRGFKLLADVIEGVKFVDGEKQEVETLDSGSATLNINDIRISWSVKSPEGWMAVTPEFKFTAGQQKLLDKIEYP
jgi:hypothetical protein